MFFTAALPSILLLLTKSWLAQANGQDQQPGSTPSAPSIQNTIYNDQNLRYLATIIVNGQGMLGSALNVTLDTGEYRHVVGGIQERSSSWIIKLRRHRLNPRNGVGPFEDTGVSHKITYMGGNYINGTIGLVEVSVAGYTIPKQAFINITKIVGLDQCGHGDCGLIGLGFDSPIQGIENALTKAGKDGPTLGKSVLSSIFDMNPDKGRFFALSMSRQRDPADSALATLYISDYDPLWSRVQHTAPYPVFPPNQTSWNILSKGFTVNGYSIPIIARNNGAPAGQILIGLDSGSPGVTTTPEIRDAIYSQIPGAVLSRNSSIPSKNYRTDQDIWVVPCNATVNFTVDFESTSYPIHPLDLTAIYTNVHNGVNRTICVNTITNGGGTSKSKDVLWGDPFLRNVYTVYNFGNTTTSPFIQFYPQTDAVLAAQDFAAVRKQLLANSAPELSPIDLVHIYDGPSAGIPATPNTPTSSSCGAQVGAGHLVTDAALSVSTADSTLGTHAPVIIGLLAANLLLLLGLLALAVIQFMRHGGKVGMPGSQSAPRYVPVHVRDESTSLNRAAYVEAKRYSDD
ncbi:aspartic peptidase domain-containing protein [Mycena galopus ATCC 62051]|nr:aspartic peptidase domain-containing protein [Mycena galopus ATCC 62051]KAF8175988.1 aspartic peptidase domain-containing protein [Mycena galopus ATCC 62051]